VRARKKRIRDRIGGLFKKEIYINGRNRRLFKRK